VNEKGQPPVRGLASLFRSAPVSHNRLLDRLSGENIHSEDLMRAWLSLLLPALFACSSATEPTADSPAETRELSNGMVQERRIGTIVHYRDPVRVEVPESVARGESFVVKVTTYGGGCIAKGDTEVRTEGFDVRVTPYDWEVVRTPPNTACTDDLRLYQHTATLRFDQPGTIRVTIRGREKPSGQVLTVERKTMVR
jgi:hypothetical protein